eukprot:c33894_g1_i1 orf=85-426(+)
MVRGFGSSDHYFNDHPRMGVADGAFISHPNQMQVEIMEGQDGVHVHIRCERRAGIVAQLVAAIEENGLRLSHANISSGHSIIFDIIGEQREDMPPVEVESLHEALMDVIVSYR